jgi:DDE family transposase
MRLSHTPAAILAKFDDPNLVSHAGLIPVMRLAQNAGLPHLTDKLVKLGTTAGANAAAKVSSIVAGMAAGADSIDDLDVVRHGALPVLFRGIRAPSTLGTFLRNFTLGHVAQLENMANQVLANLQALTPLLPGITTLAFLDIDSKTTEVFGPGKDGAAVGHTGIRGLDFLAATLSSPISAPVITGTRLRGGNANTRRAATSFVRTNLTTARQNCGATGTLLVRMDSGYYSGDILATILEEGARFSVTAPQNPSVRAAITTIPEDTWQKITYGKPVYDNDTQQWVHTAEIAETTYTAFTNTTRNGQYITARLLVRRVLQPTGDTTAALFPTYRHQAVFTNSAFDMVTAEAQHRDRAGAIEQVFADLNDSALAHFPSGRFAANAAWLTLAALTHNLLRATGCLTSRAHATARTATLRRHLVTIAARIARSARVIVIHLPRNWPWADSYTGLFAATQHPPAMT